MKPASVDECDDMLAYYARARVVHVSVLLDTLIFTLALLLPTRDAIDVHVFMHGLYSQVSMISRWIGS